MKRILYHGSERVIEKPVYGYGNKHNDYGCGFYCCSNSNAAKEWATRKSENGFLNKYELRDDRLKLIDLTKGKFDDVLIWLTLLIKNRSTLQSLENSFPKETEYLFKNYLIDITEYDVAIGYRADDAYFRFPEAFISGQITLEGLKEIYLLGDIGKQYVLLSKKSFDLIKFIGFDEAGVEYYDAYYSRINRANNRFKELLQKEQYRKGTRLKDLI